MEKSKILSAILLTLTFLLGIGVGMLIDLPALSDTATDKTHPHGYLHNKPRGPGYRHRNVRAKFKEKLIADLKLSKEQVKQLDEILAKQSERYRQLREQMKPMFAKFDEVRRSTREQIKAILTEAQLAKFNRRIKEFDERRKRYRERLKAERKNAHKKSMSAPKEANQSRSKATK